VVEARPTIGPQFDLALDLPSGPRGMTWLGSSFLVGRRAEPWGFVRIAPVTEGRYRVEGVPVIEPELGQNMSVSAVTFDGAAVIAYTDGSWLQTDGSVFTLHDPETLRLRRHVTAPPLLGGLVWDGTGFWAATRRSTKYADEEAWLYRLDRDLNVVRRVAPPAVGCQGLAWDGEMLWFVDVFSDAIYLLDVRGAEPEIISTIRPGLEYLSGVAFDGDDVWIAEYGDDRLYRVDRARRREWLARAVAGEARVVAPATRSPVVPAAAADISELRRRLRSDDWAERLRSADELRRLGRPVDFDREQNPFATAVQPDAIAIPDWWAEMRSGTIHAGWQLLFGDRLFSSPRHAGDDSVTRPSIARYEVQVSGSGLLSPITREFEAHPGLNHLEDVEVARALGPGRYQIDLHAHVQYIDDTGTARVLSRSAVSLALEY